MSKKTRKNKENTTNETVTKTNNFSARKSTDFLLSVARTMEQINHYQDYKDRITSCGYTEEHFQTINTKQEAGQDKRQEYLEKRQERKSKCKRLKSNSNARKRKYSYFKGRVRESCKDDKELLDQLGFSSRREGSYTGFYDQYEMFLRVATTNAEVTAKLNAIGITTEALQAEATELEGFLTLWTECEHLKGLCQRLIEERDQIIKELRRLMRPLIITCKHEFQNTPQALEVLGIFVRNAPLKPKTNTEPTTEPTEPTEPTTPTEPITEPAAQRTA